MKRASLWLLRALAAGAGSAAGLEISSAAEAPRNPNGLNDSSAGTSLPLAASSVKSANRRPDVESLRRELKARLSDRVGIEAIDCEEFRRAQWSYHEGKV